MSKKYESREADDRWYPINPSSTVDGRLVEWMEEHGATHVSAVMADGWQFEVRVAEDYRAKALEHLARVIAVQKAADDKRKADAEMTKMELAYLSWFDS